MSSSPDSKDKSSPSGDSCSCSCPSSSSSGGSSSSSSPPSVSPPSSSSCSSSKLPRDGTFELGVAQAGTLAVLDERQMIYVPAMEEMNGKRYENNVENNKEKKQPSCILIYSVNLKIIIFVLRKCLYGVEITYLF
ncbi:uncharacterized protein LOC121379113 [Gigantopelta aegis]|uniref:uncharacterized protein LOC121379113 n=1 Tax=Gigantopelta aegis TaxID=1735272 RepID=UPI001B88C53A|nr:uncharacterized protein LOC121379113 [Gigantopelta aegis]